jgi:hypothetical protein
LAIITGDPFLVASQQANKNNNLPPVQKTGGKLINAGC